MDSSPVGLGVILTQDDDKVVCYGILCVKKLRNVQLYKEHNFYTRCRKCYKLHTDNNEDVDLNNFTAMKSIRDGLTVHSDNILLRNNHIVLLKTLWQTAVNIAHEGIQGMSKTKAFLHSKVWFLGTDGVVEDVV